MVETPSPGWTFLTNHAQVLVCIAHDPGVRLREIGERVGITERAAHRIERGAGIAPAAQPTSLRDSG